MAPATERPLPLPDPLSQPFWDAAREHRLCVQACRQCDHLAYPPEIACRGCSGGDLYFREVSGRATLHSWTVLRDPPSPGFRDRLPVILAVVELEERKGLLLSTNLIDTAPETLRIDLPVEVRFEDVSDDCTFIHFAGGA